MLRYTVLRFAVFGACLGIVWAVLRPVGNEVTLAVAAAALLSLPLSYYLLRGPRAAAADQLARRAKAHQDAAAAHAAKRVDDVSEDAEVDALAGSDDRDDFR